MISLKKIKKILRDHDIEGYIKIHGTPDDEYDSEAENIWILLQAEPYPTEENILAVLKRVWVQYFNLDDDDLQKRIPRLKDVARWLVAE